MNSLCGIRPFCKKKDMSLFDPDTLLTLLSRTGGYPTVQEGLKRIRIHYGISRTQAGKWIQNLVEGQHLEYIQQFGSTCLKPCFMKPVRISEHFILKPPGFGGSSDLDPIEIVLAPGISFGSGEHPTTQLCLKAIDACFFGDLDIKLRPDAVGIDIGTGSGVLAMAVCMAGLAACLAYEIDPVAVHEAQKNIAANRLEGRIQMIEGTLAVCRPHRFSIICANLRYPTLSGLAGLIRDGLEQGGVAVLSGVREWEKQELLADYNGQAFDRVWQMDMKQWSAFVLVRR